MNTINIEENYKSTQDKINTNNILNEIVDYNNNYDLKVSLVNIDSRYRNKIPNNIIDMNTTILPNNPLYTIQDSQIIKLNIPNHNFNVSDKIIIQNINSNKKILNNPIYFLDSFDYYIVNMKDHNLLNNGLIYIKNYEPLTTNDYLISNIPINSIIGYNNIYKYSPNVDNSFLSSTIYNKLLLLLNITQAELITNYFFIKLPFKYINSNVSLLNNIYNLPKIFEFTFTSIGGIPLQYLNANYPINYLQYQSSQEITLIEPDFIYFKTPIFATTTEQSGGNSIIVGKIINTIEGYPDANNYTIQLKKSFTDIVRIELVSTEIPYVNFNIINNNNNKIYWQYLDDGDYIYNVTIKEGSYDPASLINEMKLVMNKIPRIISTPTKPIYNLFDITVNNNSQEVQFIAYKYLNLPNCLTLSLDPTFGDEIVVMSIKQYNNFINIGDTITITGANSIGDVSSQLINGIHIVYSIDKDTSIYTVLINLNQTYQNINLVGNGGQNINIQIPANISFLFNYPNTIGNILGFKYVGEPNAITPFAHITSNFNEYILPTPYDEVGNSNISNSLLNLNGDFYYLLLYINDFEGIQTNNNINNAFSKIAMIGNSGDVMFNTFINSPLEFDIPLNSFDEINVSFIFPDGSKPDFRNFDHSFTLRITEKINKVNRTGLNSQKISVLDMIKEINIM